MGAEYAKLFNKPLYVFDQERDALVPLDRRRLGGARNPVITHPHFTGTGTRFLRDNGRAAIDGLFARTFGSRR